MPATTRSQTKTTAQKTLAATPDLETVFRQIHRGASGWRLLHVNHSDLTTPNRIMWWATGIEEGAFDDDAVPASDYRAVYAYIRQK